MPTINSESLEPTKVMSIPIRCNSDSDIMKNRRISDSGLYDGFKPVNERMIFKGNSLQLTKFIFEDNEGKERSVEGIQKKLKNGSTTNDNNATCVLSIAILKRHILCDCLILVKQYRAPIKAYTLEFPSKIVEHSDEINTGEAAIKELQDNTGYKSTVIKHISPYTALDPDLTDSRLKMVSLLIDGDDPIKNDLISEDTNDKITNIEVIQVPINGLLDRLTTYSNNGIIIDSRVYAFAIGLKKGEKLSQLSVHPEPCEETAI